MRADSFRFSPPVCELEPELRWTLTRAFGPGPGPPIVIDRPDRVLGWASTLALRERIAGRNDRTDAERELPTEVVEQLWLAREALTARTLLLRELLGSVCARAVEIGTRVVALKGIALIESELADVGTRPLLDLDLLVDPERATDLARRLKEAGLERTGPGEPHHLPPMADRRLGEVELHLSLPGVSLPGGLPVSPATLARSDHARPAEATVGLDLPSPSLLAAHALAHALDQHGWSPSAYPVTRLVGDLVDLAPALPAEPHPGIDVAVSVRERRAAQALARALAAGEPDGGGDDAWALLRHTLVAISSKSYRGRLRRRAALRALRRGRWSKFRSELRRWSGRQPKLE